MRFVYRLRGKRDRAVGESSLPDELSVLSGDDLIGDHVVSTLRDYVFFHQVSLLSIGTTFNDLLRVGLTDSRQRD